MKNTKKENVSITKPLLAGLVAPAFRKPVEVSSEIEKPSFGKTLKKQADLTQDSGGGYNPDRTFIQD